MKKPPKSLEKHHKRRNVCDIKRATNLMQLLQAWDILYYSLLFILIDFKSYLLLYFVHLNNGCSDTKDFMFFNTFTDKLQEIKAENLKSCLISMFFSHWCVA